MRGEIQSMKESFQSLGFALALAVLLIYLVMVTQFRSFLDPFIVMVSAGDAIVGVVAALLLTGTSFNIQVFLGLIFVFGIAVSNKVLIVDFANRLLEQGLTIERAALEAARIRLRPILMTSLATLIALLPMAIGFGHGSEANVPLARAVVGGHAVSTLVALIVVPTNYVTLKKLKAGRGRT
jgi:multidrug efflux pump subunit AcrB